MEAEIEFALWERPLTSVSLKLTYKTASHDATEIGAVVGPADDVLTLHVPCGKDGGPNSTMESR